jgi:azurin
MNRSKIWYSLVLLAAASGFAHAAAAKTCEVAIEGDDAMKFNKTEIAIAGDCTEVRLTLKHTGKLPVTAMGHNWVLTQTSDFQSVANDGAKAGPKADYLPSNDPRIIAHTKLIGGGESTSVTFPTSKLKQGGDYTFFCSFPGHWAQMKGKLKFG